MSKGTLRAVIVGCGLIGQRRARALSGLGTKLVACADIDGARAEAVAGLADGCASFTDWRVMLAQIECDLVIVATLHDTLAEITEAAIRRGRHVLVEKPAARQPSEIEALIAAAG